MADARGSEAGRRMREWLIENDLLKPFVHGAPHPLDPSPLDHEIGDVHPYLTYKDLYKKDGNGDYPTFYMNWDNDGESPLRVLRMDREGRRAALRNIEHGRTSNGRYPSRREIR